MLKTTPYHHSPLWNWQ